MSAVTNAFPLPEVYYEHQKSAYWITDAKNKWIKVNELSVGRFLKRSGFSGKIADGQFVSPVDDAIVKIQQEYNVDYAGGLAGHNSGFYQMNGSGILVTESPKLIIPKEGTWNVIDSFLNGLLHDEIIDQRPYFYGWMKGAWSVVKNHRFSPGQALAIAGPVGSGKSLLQNLITEILGGRSCDPFLFMIGKTPFNEDMFRCEHLMLEDKNEPIDIRKRREFGAFMKQFTVNKTQNCHGKNKKALILTPLWRLTITLNDGPDRIFILPPLDKDIAEKIILLKANCHPMPMPASTDEEKQVFWNTLIGELPAFLYFIENYQIPPELVSPRYGVVHYHHPKLVEMLNSSTPEQQLIELIDASNIFTPGTISTPKFWEGKVSDLKEALGKQGPSASRDAGELLAHPNTCGKYLTRLKEKYPNRISNRTVAGYTVWRIQPCELKLPLESENSMSQSPFNNSQTADSSTVSDCKNAKNN